MEFFSYLLEHRIEIEKLLLEHINLTLISVGFAILIGVPIGILISHFKGINKPIMTVANTIQAIPSMALLGFLIPFLGIGVTPSIFMVILYSLLPIIKNTYTSIEGINPQMIEAAEGIGLTKFQILFKIQIPMALPVIMAGIRISAVTAVGLMTIAAFVGAGGLGYLVFSGIRTANTYQILAGALPACILALLIDWIASIIEKILVPEGINSTNENTNKKKSILQKLFILILLLGVLFNFGKNIYDNFMMHKSKKITIATKDYTEQIILGNMVAELIEDKTDIKVERKFSLGGTQIIFNGLKAKEVDMYMDYTGTILSDILKHRYLEENIKSDEVYSIIKQEMEESYPVVIGDELAFNNTFTLALRKGTIEKYKLKNISDLAKISSKLVFSPTFDFVHREDGLVGLEKMYDKLKFGSVTPVDGALRYQSLVMKESDVIDAYSTDGLLKAYDLIVLNDDKKFFPPYHLVPVFRKEIYEEYPEIREITNPLIELLTDDTMRTLNNEVDTEKKDPVEVAHNFLVENGLLSNLEEQK